MNNIFNTLNLLNIGDHIKVNDWECDMVVYGISEHYIVAADIHSNNMYTIISKIPNDNCYNGMPIGECICAPDWWLFGVLLEGFEYPQYQFDNPKWVKAYLDSLERGKTEMSLKNRAVVYLLEICNEEKAKYE